MPDARVRPAIPEEPELLSGVEGLGLRSLGFRVSGLGFRV